MTQIRAYTIRELVCDDEALLYEMLYHAIYVPKDGSPPPRDVVRQPELRKYVEGFGKPDDLGYAAIGREHTQPIGAAWLRLLVGKNRGYGYVDDGTPELTAAVLPAYRGLGIGTALIKQLLTAAAERYRAVSLSVRCQNPAYRLYERLGFEVIQRRERDAVIVARFRPEGRRVHE